MLLKDREMSRSLGFIVARVLTAALLFWALSRHPIGYYTILRLVTCGTCSYGAYLAVQSKQIGWAFVFGAIALLFQPLIAFRMTKQTWNYVDVLTAVFLVATIFIFPKHEAES
jgi:hypothetical protein